jgi:hypothetical protein
MFVQGVLLAVPLSVIIYRYLLSGPSNLPPGPPRRFLRDNRQDVPARHPWKTFFAWNKKYGNTLYSNVYTNSHDIL